jgi:hypothetical protein
MPFSAFTVRYQSAGMIPPPYTHFYTLTLRPTPDKLLAVEFAIDYTDREELDEEDITGEGFTLTDDFSWSGTLGAAWTPVVERLLKRMKLKPFDETALGEADEYVELLLTTTTQGEQVGTPADVEVFLYAMQELIQAIYEAGGKEKPFTLIYLNYTPTGDLELRVNASFAERTVSLTKRRNRQEQTQPLPWEHLRQVMSTVYAHDYSPDESLPRPPKRDGCYLNPSGGDEWYDIGRLPDVQRALEGL